MTLTRFAKDLLQQELKLEGEYVWKNNGCYCLTPGDFLLRIYLEKQSFGYFALVLDILPLIAPIRFDYTGKNLVSIGCVATNVSCAMLRKGLINFSEMSYSTMRSKDPESSYIVCADMIHRYVNPYFKEVHTIQNYYDHEMADMQSCFNRSAHKDAYSFPNNCVWYNAAISAKAYVFAFVGNHEHALSYIQLSGKNADQYTKEHYAELEQAIHSGDPNTLEELFCRCYQNNRILIKDFLQLDLPERSRFVLK